MRTKRIWIMKKLAYLLPLTALISLCLSSGCSNCGTCGGSDEPALDTTSALAPAVETPISDASEPAADTTEAADTDGQTPLVDKAALKDKLTPLQYRVVVENGTEPPFNNKYWDNKKAGIYVDIVSGKPLFSSTDKFRSGTGWPSFTQPIDKTEVLDVEDKSHGMVRVEVRSKSSDAHLGHVFDDGPAPTGMRYCINSASLRFVPVDDLEKEGLSDLKKLFTK